MRKGGGPSERETGMILVNVLLFVAIASGIVLLMINAEDSALERGLKMREAARAQAIARGGEISAITALRRDALVAADTDNVTEPWAKLAEQDAPLDGGSFDLAIADAQGRFNINALMSGDAAPVRMLGRIGEAVGIAPAELPKAIGLVRTLGPFSDLRPLRLAGLPPAQLATLNGLITALPYDGKINLNAASEPMLALLLSDAVAAQRLVRLRERQGYLTAADLASANVAVPPGTGFTSNMFWVRTRVRIGDTHSQLTSLIARKTDVPGQPQVFVVARWWGGSPPDQAPALP
jgi:general secretion pathway protein K